ncbi:MAG: APC family permease, partial [Gaiellales bacterium]
LKEHHQLSIFLIIKAFAAGTTALTGVEAIADGTAAFRYPQSKNAAATLTIMGLLAISMFLGVSILADQTNVHYMEEASRTVVAQIAFAVFNGGPVFYFLQIMTAAILVLAANTAYQDFPRLSSILAADSFMPHQFKSRGDRLVFSNGVIILAVLASIVIIIFDANLTKLIQLYLIGVFISFTLSQTGLVIRFRKLKPSGWKRKALMSGFGAVVTGIVLGVIAITKFEGGAWIIMVSIPVLMYVMRSIYVHYKSVEQQLLAAERRPVDRRPGDQHFVIYVHHLDAAAARAVGYARSVRPASLSAVTFDPAHAGTWMRLAPDVPLESLAPNGSKAKSLRRYLEDRRSQLPDDDFLTVVVPEVLETKSLIEILRRPALHRLKASLLFASGVQVLDVPIVRDQISGTDQAHEPGRNYVVVLVSDVHNAALQAIEYAETLRATDVRAVTIGLEPEESGRIGDAWLEARVPHPLEIEAAPFRDIATALLGYIAQFNADGVDRVVTVVLPEFVVTKRRHQILHGQTALIVKRHLLFERGVVVASVPYHLQD